MNENLKKEIIDHIFNQFGLLSNKNKIRQITKENPISEQFLLQEKLEFETDGKIYKNNIWSAETDIKGSRVQFIVADLTEVIPEYALLIQMDDFPPYSIRISSDIEDSGSIFFKFEDHWIPADTIFQARLLIAVESIMNLFVEWKKNAKVEGIYKDLISFLKFESEEEDEE